MHLLIGCDAGGAHGLGHLSRSMALAEEAVGRGHRVSVTGDVTGELALAQVAEAGAALVSPEQVGPLAPDVLHVDSYRDDFPLGPQVPGGVALTSSTRDGRFGVRASAVVIDPTVGADADPEPVDAPVVLAGSRYVALRRRVLAHRGAAREPDGPARSALVVLGGTDPLGLAPSVVRLLLRAAPQLAVTVVSGQRTAPALDELAAAGGGETPTAGPGRVRVTRPVPDLPALMVRHDLVVSAAGTTALELAALRVPMLLLEAVPNQRPGYLAMVGRGAALGLGGPADLADARAARAAGAAGAAEAAGAVTRAVQDPAVRRAMVERAAGLVDGLGAWRVVSTWEQLLDRVGEHPAYRRGGLTARPAGTGDAELLWRWRNDPATRAVSRQREEIPLAAHRTWLSATLDRADRVLLVVQDGATPVGTVRWDETGPGEWEVSITVAPERRGRGLAAQVLAAGEAALRAGAPGAVLLAGVHEQNPASLRLFSRAGYLPDQPADGAGFVVLRKDERRVAGPARAGPS